MTCALLVYLPVVCNTCLIFVMSMQPLKNYYKNENKNKNTFISEKKCNIIIIFIKYVTYNSFLETAIMGQGWPVAFTAGICHRYLPVNTGVDNTPKSGVYRHLLAFINISLISLQITLLTVLATYYIMHGHHSTIFAAYA